MRDLIAATYIIVVHAGSRNTGMAFQCAAFEDFTILSWTSQQKTHIFYPIITIL